MIQNPSLTGTDPYPGLKQYTCSSRDCKMSYSRVVASQWRSRYRSHTPMSLYEFCFCCVWPRCGIVPTELSLFPLDKTARSVITSCQLPATAKPHNYEKWQIGRIYHKYPYNAMTVWEGSCCAQLKRASSSDDCQFYWHAFHPVN